MESGRWLGHISFFVAAPMKPSHRLSALHMSKGDILGSVNISSPWGTWGGTHCIFPTSARGLTCFVPMIRLLGGFVKMPNQNLRPTCKTGNGHNTWRTFLGIAGSAPWPGRSQRVAARPKNSAGNRTGVGWNVPSFGSAEKHAPRKRKNTPLKYATHTAGLNKKNDFGGCEVLKVAVVHF